MERRSRAGSESAARAALRSLQGEFSRRVDSLLAALISLRVHVEAAIDFPEEEIDFLGDGQIRSPEQKVHRTGDGGGGAVDRQVRRLARGDAAIEREVRDQIGER